MGQEELNDIRESTTEVERPGVLGYCRLAWDNRLLWQTEGVQVQCEQATAAALWSLASTGPAEGRDGERTARPKEAEPHFHTKDPWMW